MRQAGVWEATAANGVAGVRRKIPEAKVMSKSFIRDSMLFRRGQNSTQKEPKVDAEVWEAWTMTARGIVNVYPLAAGPLASRVGPIKPVGRNAIAVGLAEDIVLVQFGNQIHDNDDDDDVDMSRLSHTRLAGRSKFG